MIQRAPLIATIVSLLATAAAAACLPDLVGVPVVPEECGDGDIDLDLGEQCDPGDAGDGGCTRSCKLRCDDGFIDPSSNHCYRWATPQPTRTLAAEACLPGQIVSFGTLEEVALVTSLARKAAGSPDAATFTAWGALERVGRRDGGEPTYAQAGEPGWSTACPGCFARTTDGGALAVLGASTAGSCVSWGESAAAPWFESSCDLVTETRAVLCEYRPAGLNWRSCGDDVCMIARSTLGSKTYKLVEAADTAADAEQGCAERKGRLVVFASRQEREQVVAAVASRGVAAAWIGLASSANGGAFTWADGKPEAAYPAVWADGEPRAKGRSRAFVGIDPLAYDTRLAHATDDPSRARPYICEL